MKRMTKAERLAKEELTKTQVLNLSELERVANYERRTSKKPAAILAILGVMLITLGLSYNSIVNVFSDTPVKEKDKTVSHKEVEKVEKPVSPVGTMNCTYTSLAAPEGYDTTVNMTLIFNNGALKNYTKIMNVETTLGQEALAATTVPNLKAAYHQTFDHLTIPGYQIVTNAKTVGFETIVSLDLTTLDITQLNAYHALNVVTKAEFALDDTEEMVMTKATALGYVCQ